MNTRKKRVWTVADFAHHAGISPRQARRLLLRLDAKHKRKLLIPSTGTNRVYTLFPAVLARLEPDLFAPIESLEFRVEALEEDACTHARAQKMIASQVGANTREIERLKRRPARA